MLSYKLEGNERELYESFSDIPVIDAHEHLPPERVRVKQHVDVFDLFIHYTKTDFFCAGMTESQWNRMHNIEVPDEKRWRILSRYLKEIRHGSYARPALTYAEYLGFDDITKDNYGEISKALQADNKPGIYKKILVDMCNIKVALTQANRTDYDLPFMVPLMPLDNWAGVRSWEDIENITSGVGEGASTIDEYLEAARRGLENWIKEGAVGIKMISRPYGNPDRSKAVSIYDELRRKPKKQIPDMNPLKDYLNEEILDIAADLDLIVAVHTGVWGDFRELDPRHMIPIFGRHPRTKFDMYHMGMPWVRDAGLIGKNNPNVWLNLCWCHIVSPEMTVSALKEWIDLVPMNKIIGFGGDYGKPVEKVYGHLLMAKENIARVLGERVDKGLLSTSEAEGIAKKWFFANPNRLYRLRV
jgi:predicted TIM-barrel fold metal-dependent hydrolase